MEGRFNGGVFALPVCGAYIWRGLFSELYGIHMLPATYDAKLVKIETNHRNWPSLKLPQNEVREGYPLGKKLRKTSAEAESDVRP